MKRVWVGLLVVALPICLLALSVLAQQGGVLRDAEPSDQSAMPTPPQDDTVTAAPLPPPDDDAKPAEGADAQPDMVPNPLDNPDAATAQVRAKRRSRKVSRFPAVGRRWEPRRCRRWTR